MTAVSEAYVATAREMRRHLLAFHSPLKTAVWILGGFAAFIACFYVSYDGSLPSGRELTDPMQGRDLTLTTAFALVVALFAVGLRHKAPDWISDAHTFYAGVSPLGDLQLSSEPKPWTRPVSHPLGSPDSIAGVVWDRAAAIAIAMLFVGAGVWLQVPTGTATPWFMPLLALQTGAFPVLGARLVLAYELHRQIRRWNREVAAA